MAVYKVLQDIEAEDKLLGPLSLKQFIFAIITAGLLFINFRVITASVLGFARWPIVAVLLIPTALFGILAAPIGKDQPTEVWLLARLRFMLRPRRRIWDQDGPQELVTITAPKRIEKRYTKNFTQGEVHSRLNALANVMDSRGWAVKNANVNLGSGPRYSPSASDDRLIGTESLPQDVSPVDVQASDDIMDEHSNSTAQQFDRMIQEAEQRHKEQLQSKITQARADKTQPPSKAPNAEEAWFQAQQTEASVVPAAHLVAGGQGQTVAPHASSIPTPAVAESVAAPSAAQEEALLKKMHAEQAQHQQTSSFGHLKTLQPLHEPTAQATTQTEQAAQTTTQPPSPPQPNPDIINLARDNDKTVETLARQANKVKETKLDDGEVVVSLH